MHATGNLNRVGVGWVPVAARGPTLLALAWRGKTPPAAHTRLCIFGPMASSLLLRWWEALVGAVWWGDATRLGGEPTCEHRLRAACADPAARTPCGARAPADGEGRGSSVSECKPPHLAHQRAVTLGELQRQHQIAGGRVGTQPRPAQGVGGGRVCHPARGHASPHPSQLNATLLPSHISLALPRGIAPVPVRAGPERYPCGCW